MSYGKLEWPWVVAGGPVWLQTAYKWYRREYVCSKGRHEWHAAGPNGHCPYCNAYHIHGTPDGTLAVHREEAV